MKEYIGYHGTDREIFNKIKQDGFKLERPKGTLPCDLGKGIYMFIQREKFPKECPKRNAEKYVNSIKHSYKDPVVIKIVSRIEDGNILNMNSECNQAFFLDFKEKNLDSLEKGFSSKKYSPTRNRGKVDGMVFDIMIKALNLKVDAIIIDSYTPFNFEGYRQSNIPNGRELCLRNPNKINLYEIS